MNRGKTTNPSSSSLAVFGAKPDRVRIRSFIAESGASFIEFAARAAKNRTDMLFRRGSWRIVVEPLVFERDGIPGRAEEMT